MKFLCSYFSKVGIVCPKDLLLKTYIIKLNMFTPPKLFRAFDSCILIQILDLSATNHDLYLRRRRNDTMEIQHMKAQAREEKLRREVVSPF